MKKHILGIAMIAAVIIGSLSGQASAHASSSSVHTVKPGDTLWEIARDNNVTVDDLLTWNELDSTLIFPNQELKIEKEIDIYVVKKGDTLFEIAEDHDIVLEDLMTWNEISSHLIFPGDQLALDEPDIPEILPESNGEVLPSLVQTTAHFPAVAQVPDAPPPVAKAPAPTKAKTTATTTTATTQAAAAKAPSSPAGKEMVVTATAYTAYCDGCSGITYTGIDLRSNPNQKVIAVDPNVIPLGTRVWVEGYGEAIAGDIGGAIKGNIIDVFLQHQQDALNWGRRTVTIKILE